MEGMDRGKELCNFTTSWWEAKGPGSALPALEVIMVQDVPEQANAYDCGVFVCNFASCLTQGHALDQQEFPMEPDRNVVNCKELRLRVCKEILDGRIEGQS